MFGQLGLQLISDISMRIYSEASIAENPLLVAVLFRKVRVRNCVDAFLCPKALAFSK
jgi:hypothetical protein